MAQSCTVKLPKDVRLGDVLDVIGILTGSKAEWEMLSKRWIEVWNVVNWNVCKSENLVDDYNVYGQEGYGFGHYIVHVRENTLDKEHHIAFVIMKQVGITISLMAVPTCSGRQLIRN